MFYDLKVFSFLLFMSMKWRYTVCTAGAFEAAYEQIYVQAVPAHRSSILKVSSFSSAVQVVAMDKGMLSCLSVSMKGGEVREAVLGSLINVCIDVKGGTKQRT